MFSIHKPTSHFLSKKETEDIMNCVQQNEQRTSGEIRICIESTCVYTEPLHRAHEIFWNLKMHQTEHRNAVLVYIAYKDQDFALYADKELYAKTAPSFWQEQSKLLARQFYQQKQVQGIKHCIQEIGELLAKEFPLHGERKNELPDEIIFGK